MQLITIYAQSQAADVGVRHAARCEVLAPTVNDRNNAHDLCGSLR
jgi:hypothetical protein